MLAWGSRGWGGGGSLSARRTVSSHHYAQHRPAPAMHGCNTAQQRRSRTTLVCMAKKTYYEVLGVTSTASMKDIKSAYRKAALKLHPDVNNAPDAKERFMEAKAAFETLTDDKKRAEYDRRLRMGFGTQGFDSKSYSSRSSTSSSGSYGYSGTRTRPSTPPQGDYSFDDLLRDLDKEFREWNASRASKPGAGNKSSSLWEELESIGEELVDFLEETIGVSDAEDDKDKGAKAKGPASKDESAGGQRSGTKADKGTQTTDYTNSDFYKKYEEPLRQATGGSYQEPPKQAPKKPPEQEIDDMLAELKKKYNRK